MLEHQESRTIVHSFCLLDDKHPDLEHIFFSPFYTARNSTKIHNTITVSVELLDILQIIFELNWKLQNML
jgi:hypothetical protein